MRDMRARLLPNLAVLVAAVLFCAPAFAQVTGVVLSPLPVQRFVDNNGNPCSGCKVFTYTAGTMTKLATYTDSTGATPNVNPVILNTRGEAGIWLTGGPYKFVLSPSTDSDPPTNPFWTVDNITSGSFIVTTAPFISTIPTGNTVPTMSSVLVQASSISTSTREFLFQIGYNVTTGVNLGNAGAGDRVALYAGAVVHPGAGNVWGENILVTLLPGSSSGHFQISELDMNNNNKLVDQTIGPAGMQFPPPTASGNLYSYGLIMESAGTFDETAAIVVAGSQITHRGIGCFSNVSDACFYDYTNSTEVMSAYGTHTNGIDLSQATISGFSFASKSFTVQEGGAVNVTGSTDTNVAIGTTGPPSAVWNLQTVVSGTPTGRFRILDATYNREMFAIQQNGKEVDIASPVVIVSMAVSCAGMSTGTLINNGGVVNVFP